MDIHWPDNYKDGVALQESLRPKVIIEPFNKRIKIIAGVDAAVCRKEDFIYAAILLFSYPDLGPVEEATAIITTPFPYVPGLLSLREGPAIMDAYRRLSYRPDLIIFDGQGIAHPRGMGIASHIGVLLDIPTIGCAKSRLVGEYREPGPRKGDYSMLIFEGKEVGAVVRTKDRVRPLFISPGHRIDIKSAVDIILSLCRGYRLPHPVRLAHIRAGRLRGQKSEVGSKK